MDTNTALDGIRKVCRAKLGHVAWMQDPHTLALVQSLLKLVNAEYYRLKTPDPNDDIRALAAARGREQVEGKIVDILREHGFNITGESESRTPTGASTGAAGVTPLHQEEGADS